MVTVSTLVDTRELLVTVCCIIPSMTRSLAHVTETMTTIPKTVLNCTRGAGGPESKFTQITTNF